MSSQGYIRYPTIHQDTIVFVSEDDLWLVSSEGGRAERLTAGVAEVSYPRFSPDGTQLAFVGEEEGPSEIYAMPALGGLAKRLTFKPPLLARQQAGHLAETRYSIPVIQDNSLHALRPSIRSIPRAANHASFLSAWQMPSHMAPTGASCSAAI